MDTEEVVFACLGAAATAVFFGWYLGAGFFQTVLTSVAIGAILWAVQ
jgi:hypothetical protein